MDINYTLSSGRLDYSNGNYEETFSLTNFSSYKNHYLTIKWQNPPDYPYSYSYQGQYTVDILSVTLTPK